jgi:hypothetical protein
VTSAKAAPGKIDTSQDLAGIGLGSDAAMTTGSDVKSVARPLGPEAMMMGAPQVSRDDEQVNVRELIRQAQVALKNGGGEIKMALKPEGLGQVKLKVSVNDGQVSVEMLTENDAAKRMLEKGLSDLKSSLAAQELKVESLKVDVGQEIKKHMDGSADEQSRQSRQGIGELMSQMRDERQSFQQGMMENPGFRRYNSRGPSGDVGPESAGAAARAAAARNAYRPRASGRLDLVA